MDQSTWLGTWLSTWFGIAALVLSVVVAIVVIAMPFLVWGIHTRIQEMQRDVTQIKFDVNDTKLTVEAIDAVLEDLVNHGTIRGETRDKVAHLRDRRFSTAFERAAEAANRHLEALRDPHSPEAIKAAKAKRLAERVRWGILFVIVALVMAYLITVWIGGRRSL